MGQLTNQIRVLLQRVKLAGREPHKILMHCGLYEVLRGELVGKIIHKREANIDFDSAVDCMRGMVDMTFEGIPIVVNNTLKEILIQTKPRPMSDQETFGERDWKNIIRVDTL